jgi:hypothetical protein
MLLLLAGAAYRFGTALQLWTRATVSWQHYEREFIREGELADEGQAQAQLKNPVLGRHGGTGSAR